MTNTIIINERIARMMELQKELRRLRAEVGKVAGQLISDGLVLEPEEAPFTELVQAYVDADETFAEVENRFFFLDSGLTESISHLSVVRAALPRKRVSIDNGLTYVDPMKAIKDMDWNVIAHYMEDEAREQTHNELAPCSNLMFLNRYLEVAQHDLIIG